MTAILGYSLKCLMYLIACLVIVHLGRIAITTGRSTAWIMLIGVALLLVGNMLEWIYPPIVFDTENAQKGIRSETREPYFAILQCDLAVGELLVVCGLAVEIGQRAITARRIRRAASDPNRTLPENSA